VSTSPERLRRRNGRTNPLITAAIVAVALAFLSAAFLGSGPDDDGEAGSTTSASGYDYQVGEPGPGIRAPELSLPATTGHVDLQDLEGQRVLIYLQEGLMCQPCWDQLTAIEERWDDFEALGIDQIVTVTTDELEPLEQKVAIEGITTPVAADPARDVSRSYDGLSYGMMGGSHNGHTFIVVGPDGTIEWRADYGGAPDYTMYMPVDALLADLAAQPEAAGT
jgi:peroxiredoxin